MNTLNCKNDFNGRKQHKAFKNFRSNWQLLMLCLPAIICLFVFSYLPMSGIVIAFKDYRLAKGIFESEWAGFKNFEFFFKSQDMIIILRNTIGYGIVFIALKIILGVFLALVLYEVSSRRAIKYYQTTMILPNFLSWVVVGYISYILLNPDVGILNSLLELLGHEEIQWYTERKYWPFILTIANSWKHVGMDMILFYAALMGIDPSYYEAAKIDGANKLQQIKSISIPLLSSIICIQIILALGNIIRGDFGLFYQIPRNIGTLYPVTDIIDTYVQRGLTQGNMAPTAAVGLFQSVTGLILIITANFTIKKISPENSLF